MSTSHRALITSGWGVKAGVVRVWLAGKTVWCHCYTQAISERFRDKGHNKALYKFICLLYENILWIRRSWPIQLPLTKASRASSDTVSCTFSYHTWQFIVFTIFTITACTASSLTCSVFHFELKTWLFNKSFPPDLFLSYRTDYADCTGKCVRLSRPLVGFRMHFKSLHFYSFIHLFKVRRHDNL